MPSIAQQPYIETTLRGLVIQMLPADLYEKYGESDTTSNRATILQQYLHNYCTTHSSHLALVMRFSMQTQALEYDSIYGKECTRHVINTLPSIPKEYCESLVDAAKEASSNLWSAAITLYTLNYRYDSEKAKVVGDNDSGLFTSPKPHILTSRHFTASFSFPYQVEQTLDALLALYLEYSNYELNKAHKAAAYSVNLDLAQKLNYMYIGGTSPCYIGAVEEKMRLLVEDSRHQVQQSFDKEAYNLVNRLKAAIVQDPTNNDESQNHPQENFDNSAWYSTIADASTTIGYNTTYLVINDA